MTFQYQDISRRTKLLIVLLSLLINTTFIMLVLNSKRQSLIPLATQVIKLDEEEIIPSQFMQLQPTSAPQPLATQVPATPATPQQQPEPMPQKDFEWVSGATGMGKPGTPEQEKTLTPESHPEPIIEEEKEIEEEEEETFENTDLTETAPTPDILKADIPAASAVIAEEPAIIEQQQRKQASAQKKSSRPTRTLPSLAELTKNFVDFTTNNDEVGNGGGGHAIGVHGAPTGVVSEKQLTYERYLRKLLVCISTSCKIHKRSIPRTTQKTQARVQFVLNRDGSYYTLGMAQSSGNPAIDDLILTVFNDASSSFPPVPQSLSVPFIAPTFLLNSIQDLLVPEAWSVSIGA